MNFHRLVCISKIPGQRMFLALKLIHNHCTYCMCFIKTISFKYIFYLTTFPAHSYSFLLLFFLLLSLWLAFFFLHTVSLLLPCNMLVGGRVGRRLHVPRKNSRIHKEGQHDICISVSGLFYLTRWSLVAPIFSAHNVSFIPVYKRKKFFRLWAWACCLAFLRPSFPFLNISICLHYYDMETILYMKHVSSVLVISSSHYSVNFSTRNHTGHI